MLQSDVQSTMSWASWSDVPYEISEQILWLCDNQSLLALGKVNRLLNLLALEQLFKRNGVSNPKEGYVVSRMAPKEIVPALCAASWIQHLSRITFYLNPSVQRFFSEVRGLTALIRRLPSIDRLDIYFSSVDYWLNNAYSRGNVPQQLWMQLFTTLLDVALSKGCKFMRIEGAHKMKKHYAGTGPTKDHHHRVRATQETESISVAPRSWSPSKPNILRRFFCWTKKRPAWKVSTQTSNHRDDLRHPITEPKVELLPKTSRNTHSTPEQSSLHGSSPCLVTLSLESSMLLQPLFFFHTLHLLQCHSSTLQNLELIGIKISGEAWEQLFTNITLPVLESFTYRFDALIVSNPKLTPRILLDFLVRHSTILSLELYGVSLLDIFPELDYAILPNLRHFDAHPRIVSWLLHHSSCCSKLESVCLTSEYGHPLTQFTFDHPERHPYQHFNDGILSVALLSRSLKLKFKFGTESGLWRWISQNVDAREASELRHLKHTTSLTISCHYHTYLSSVLLNLLPRWFALFPCLESLSIIEVRDPEGLQTQEFRAAVLKANPSLKFWIVGREVMLGEFRSGLHA